MPRTLYFLSVSLLWELKPGRGARGRVAGDRFRGDGRGTRYITISTSQSVMLLTFDECFPQHLRSSEATRLRGVQF